MNIFCDIDGTLTDDGEHRNGIPNLYRICKIKQLSLTNTVYLWSGNGQTYAEEFRIKHGLLRCTAIGKPHLIIDDNPTIRPNWESLINKPYYLDKE